MVDIPHAQANKDAQITGLTQLVKTLNQKLADQQSNAPAQMDPAVQKKFVESQLASLQQQINFSEQKVANYQWELMASNVMLWVTVVVVLSGIVFSGLQLWHAMKIGSSTDGTFEASASSLKITSSVVGILILAISIGFVFLFLDRVYPIQ